MVNIMEQGDPPSHPLFPLRAPLKVSRWWGMVNIMEPGKTEKYPPLNPPPPKLKKKKYKAHSVCPWAFTLAA